MDAYRFYVPSLLQQLAATEGSPAGSLLLGDEESHHARAVLRLEQGSPVVMFDGRGAWADGVLGGGAGKRSKGELSVEISGGVHVEPPLEPRLTLLTAIPKGERAEWLVEQASQLGVACIQWLDCDRGVVKPKEGGGKIERWRRMAVESAKQCGRLHLLEVRGMRRLEAVIPKAKTDGERWLWLEPRAENGLQAVARGGDVVSALIGPEGGWSERETAFLQGLVTEGRIEGVRLTRTVLRIETACTAIGSIIMSKGES